MKQIAVTGGNGLLGRYVVRELERDYEVTVIDRVDGGEHQPHGAVDVLDLDQVQSALAGQDAIVHLAAIDAARDAAPAAFFHTNVQAAWNVLHAGYEQGVRRFALCSSSSAYGLRADGLGAAPRYLPLDEQHPLSASDPYGLSKRACETAAAGFAARAGVSVAVLRPCFVAFPHTVERMIAIHEGRDGPSAGGDPEAFRSPMPPLRWFVAPEDAARCFRLAIEHEVGFDVFNLTAEDTFAAEPTLERVEQVFGRRPEIRDTARYDHGSHASPMDASRAADVLGWRPTRRFADLRG